MAAKADDPDRVDLTLRSIASMLDDLPGLAEEWAALSPDERLAWSLDWGNEMAKLRHLAEAEAAGRLDRQRAAIFRALASRTIARLGSIEQLDLRRPADQVLSAGQVRT